MVDWKFYIDSPQQRALYACRGSLTEGCGAGDGQATGDGGGYGDGYGDGWSENEW